MRSVRGTLEWIPQRSNGRSERVEGSPPPRKLNSSTAADFPPAAPSRPRRGIPGQGVAFSRLIRFIGVSPLCPQASLPAFFPCQTRTPRFPNRTKT